MARDMTHAEWRAFVLGTPRTAKLAVVRADGRPAVAPIWVDLDGDDVMFTTGAGTVKGKALRRDARVCLCFDDEQPPFGFVVIDGIASISEEPEELLRWATSIGGRYMGHDRAEQFGRRNAVPGELLVRITPVRITAKTGISD